MPQPIEFSPGEEVALVRVSISFDSPGMDNEVFMQLSSDFVGRDWAAELDGAIQEQSGGAFGIGSLAIGRGSVEVVISIVAIGISVTAHWDDLIRNLERLAAFLGLVVPQRAPARPARVSTHLHISSTVTNSSVPDAPSRTDLPLIYLMASNAVLTLALIYLVLR